MLRRLIASVLLLACAVSAQNKRPFTFEDMMKLKRIGDPQVSPDGRWVLFMAVDVDLEANTRTSHIGLVPLVPAAKTGGDSGQLTKGTGEDRARWSPDGKHFLYGADDQIWLSDFDAASGQAQNPRKVTSI